MQLLQSHAVLSDDTTSTKADLKNFNASQFAASVAVDRLSSGKDELFRIDEKFDVIVMMEALEQIEDDLSGMRAVHNLLTNLETALLSMPANSLSCGLPRSKVPQANSFIGTRELSVRTGERNRN